MRRNKIFGLIGLALLTIVSPVAADAFLMTVDVPTQLGTGTWLANQAVRHDSGNYTLEFDGAAEGLGPAVNLDALLVLEDGSLLLSTDAPFEVGGVFFEPRDIVRYDAGVFTVHTDGGALGLNAEANIDALARDENGDLVFSLDAPEDWFGTLLGPADMILLQNGDLSIADFGVNLGLPQHANIVGLERDAAGGWHMMLDAPTWIDATLVLPGSIVRLDTITIQVTHSDPAFPPGNAGAGFSFPGSPGEVLQLTAARNGNDVDLSWQPSCSAEAQDYAIYEGTLGSWYSHVPVVCSTAGATTAPVAPQPGDRYFLVVPVNATFEGSYGIDAAGFERPAGLPACKASQRLAACP